MFGELLIFSGKLVKFECARKAQSGNGKRRIDCLIEKIATVPQISTAMFKVCMSKIKP